MANDILLGREGFMRDELKGVVNRLLHHPPV